MVLELLGSDLKAYVLGATRTSHVQREFSDCRCDIVSVRHKTTFSQGCATKIKSKQFSEFGSRTNKLAAPSRMFLNLVPHYHRLKLWSTIFQG